METIRDQQFETDRLILRPFTADDGALLFRLYGEPRVMEIRKIGLQDRAGSDAQLTEILDHWARRGFGLWAVFEKAGGGFIGECGLREVGPDTDDIEISYGLLPKSWGRGYATEASRLTLSVGFERLGLEEIVAVARGDNDVSQRVMRKLGFKFERDWRKGPVRVVRYVLRRDRWDG